MIWSSYMGKYNKPLTRSTSLKEYQGDLSCPEEVYKQNAEKDV